MDRLTELRRFVLVTGAAFTVVGCAEARSSLPPVTPVIDQRGTTTLSPPVEISIISPDISLYYPELKNFPLQASGEVLTEYSHTNWYNFSKMKFDETAAEKMFTYFENLGRSQKILNYRFGNQNIPFALDQKPRTERALFLIPQEAPAPNWPDVAFRASTTGVFTNGPYAIFVRIPDTEKDIPPSGAFTTVRLAANKFFATEACQSSLQVSSQTTEAANLGQEIVCNSWGAAFIIKQMAVPFREYSAWAREVSIQRDASSPLYPLFILSETEYNEIPLVEMPLTQAA